MLMKVTRAGCIIFMDMSAIMFLAVIWTSITARTSLCCIDGEKG